MQKHERNATIIARFRAGETVKNLAAEWGISRQAVSQMMQRHDPEYVKSTTWVRRSIPRLTPDSVFARMLVTESGCWEWTKARNNTGYGLITMGDNRGMMLVTRLVMSLKTTEPVPAGMHVCHACDNPPCCNPDHLFLGTATDNQRDRRRKERARGDRAAGMLRRACIHIAKLHNDPQCACEFCVRAWRYYHRSGEWIMSLPYEKYAAA